MGKKNKGGGRGVDGDLIGIPNRHPDPGPDLGAAISAGSYVSYFENEHAEQWVFVRPRESERAALYGGDNAWAPVEVYERTPDQLRAELLGSGLRPGSLERLSPLVDPLVGALILNESERSWLHNVWHTSGVGDATDGQATLASLGRRLAAEAAAPGLSKHPNSAEHRSAVLALALAVGREAGRRGLDDGAAAALLQHALASLSPAA